jgi:hypothetical protein
LRGVSEIRSILNRLAPRIDEVYGFRTAKLPELARSLRAETKTQIADLRTATQTLADLQPEIAQRPTRRQSIFDIFAVVGLIGAILTIAKHFAH